MLSHIFIISGPSGAGEDSIISGLKKIFPIELIITTTTRKKRPGDKQGRPYYFISKKEFIKIKNSHGFFEWAKQYNNQLYGVTNKEIKRIKKLKNKIIIWKIDYKGVLAAKKLLPEAVSIFIISPLNILKKRINKRDNATKEYIRERMDYTKKWLKLKNIYDYQVINEEGRLDQAVKKTALIIKKEISQQKKSLPKQD